MKRTLMLAALLAGTVLLTGCGGSSAPEPVSTDAPPASEAAAPETDAPAKTETAASSDDVLAPLYGYWELLDTKEDGVHLAVTDQWAFSDDGTCIFLRNARAGELDTYTYDADTNTITVKTPSETILLKYYNLLGTPSLYMTDENGEGTFEYTQVKAFTAIPEEDFEREMRENNFVADPDTFIAQRQAYIADQQAHVPFEKLQLSTILLAEDNSEISAFPEQEQIELLPNGEYRFLRNKVQILGGYWMYLCTEDGYCYLRTVSGRTANGEEMLYKENDTSLVGINVYDENDTLIRTYGYIPVDSFSSIPMPEFQEKYKSVYEDGEKMWSYFEDAAISFNGQEAWDALW